MSDDLSDVDRVRQKRLAKIQEQAQQNAAASRQEQANKASTVPDSSKASPTPSAAQNPFTQLQRGGPSTDDGVGPRPAISITPAKRDNSNARRADLKIRSTDTLDDWQHKTLASAFRITLDPARTVDTYGNSLAFLPGVRSELEETKSLRFSVASLDSVLLEAAQDHSNSKPLDYLLPCWRRITTLWRSNINDTSKKDILAEARRLCMSYCIFAITLPEMFNIDIDPIASFASYLLLDPKSDKGVDESFLAAVTAQFEEDESIKHALVATAEHLSRDLASKSMLDEYQSSLRAMVQLCGQKPIVVALSQSPSFCPPGIIATNLEKHTLLGPFFRLSPLHGPVALSYFSGHAVRERNQITNAQDSLRMTTRTLQEELFKITDSFIKAGPGPREQTLNWLAMTVNLNHRRRAMAVDETHVSSDGFMCNVTVVLDKLCEPFMDTTFSKIGRIEPEYFRRSPRVDITDETKINADQATSDAFYANKAEGQSNFISEAFFLTMAAHHYGTEAVETKLTTLRQELKRLDTTIQRIEHDREQHLGNPLMLARFDDAIRKYKQKSDEGHAVYIAIEGLMMDEQLQQRSMSFMRYVIVWLIRMVTNRNFPAENYDLPLPEDQPEVFRCLPEYFLEDVVDHFKFITSHMPRAIVTQAQCDELVMLCITFMRSSGYIKNPGVKAGFVTILYYGTLSVPNKRDGILGDVLNGHPFALKHLLHALMQAYIECESTGAHNAFYDKFNIRYEIFQVIKNIWKNEIYHENLGKESQVNPEFFIQFVNMILNDATFVLDESFTAFHKINQLSKELSDDPEAVTNEQREEREKKEKTLQEAKDKAKSYMQLTVDSVDTLILFTSVLADSFTATEIVQRLADMLDYNLDALVGPKSKNLRVENPHQYRFNPAQLLGEIATVYINLSNKRNFQVAVARDGRSYKHENFETAVGILEKHNPTKPATDRQALLAFANVVKAVKEEEDAAEADLDDAPEEFYDPLLATLMEDPVILPISRTVIDRSTIRQHLLSDPHDPFNRAPLKIEDVLPASDVKEKIQAWKAQKLAARRGNGEKMDTS